MLRKNHSYEHHVIIKYCLPGCVWPFLGDYSTNEYSMCVFTGSKMIYGWLHMRLFMCDELVIYDMYLRLTHAQNETYCLIHTVLKCWMFKLMRVWGIVQTCRDHSGLSSEIET